MNGGKTNSDCNILCFSISTRQLLNNLSKVIQLIGCTVKIPAAIISFSVLSTWQIPRVSLSLCHSSLCRLESFFFWYRMCGVCTVFRVIQHHLTYVGFHVYCIFIFLRVETYHDSLSLYPPPALSILPCILLYSINVDGLEHWELFKELCTTRIHFFVKWLIGYSMTQVCDFTSVADIHFSGLQTYFAH